MKPNNNPESVTTRALSYKSADLKERPELTKEAADFYRYIFNNNDGKSGGHFLVYPQAMEFISAQEAVGIPQDHYADISAMDRVDPNSFDKHSQTGELPIFWHHPEVTHQRIREKLLDNGHLTLFRDEQEEISRMAFAHLSDVRSEFTEEGWENPFHYSGYKDPEKFRSYQEFLAKVNAALRENRGKWKDILPSEIQFESDTLVYAWNAFATAPNERGLDTVLELLKNFFDLILSDSKIDRDLLVMGEASNPTAKAFFQATDSIAIPGILEDAEVTICPLKRLAEAFTLPTQEFKRKLIKIATTNAQKQSPIETIVKNEFEIKAYPDMSTIEPGLFEQLIAQERDTWGRDGRCEYAICSDIDCRALQSIEEVYGEDAKDKTLAELESNGPKTPCCPECGGETELILDPEPFKQYVQMYLSSGAFGSLITDSEGKLKGSTSAVQGAAGEMIGEVINYRGSYDVDDCLAKMAEVLGINPEEIADLDTVCFNKIIVDPKIRSKNCFSGLLGKMVKARPEFKDNPVILETRFDSKAYPLVRAMGFEEILSDEQGCVLVVHPNYAELSQTIAMNPDEFKAANKDNLIAARERQEEVLSNTKGDKKRIHYRGLPLLREMLAAFNEEETAAA